MAEVPASIDPVLTAIDRNEVLSDPFVREAYFGSPDTPGLIAQATSAANRAYGQPAIMRQTAGLSPLEKAAMQGAYGGIGSYQPYTDANLFGIQEGMGMSRRAGELAQPYFSGQEQYLGAATDTARQAAGMQFDPNLTKQFYDPFENRVVQQTIDDAFKGGEIADISARAQNISSGGESAFGSRARLSADERRAALGRGIGESLAAIRSGGFSQAQNTALGEFGRQAGARERLAGNLSSYGNQLGNIGAARSGLARDIGSDVAGYGGQIGNLGRTEYDLASSQRRELSDLGGIARGVKETGLGRQYERAVQNRFAPTQAASYVQGFLPQYQGGKTQINKTYGMPQDPYNQGISAFLGSYRTFAGDNRPPPQPTDMSKYTSYLDQLMAKQNPTSGQATSGLPGQQPGQGGGYNTGTNNPGGVYDT